MAAKVWCDNPSCGAEISASPSGCPVQVGRKHTYCDPCFAYVEQVENQLRVEATAAAWRAHEQIEARRAELMAQMLPPQRFPEATAPEVPRGEPAAAPWPLAVTRTVQ